MRSNGCGSSGAPRWRIRRARWARTCRRSRTTRSAGSTPIDTRAAVAFFGAFGYELDPAALGDDDYARVREQVTWYKRHRELFQFGRFLRLRGPDDLDGNETAWMSVASDRRRAIVGWYRVLARPLPGPSLLRLRGLDPDARYSIDVWPDADDELVRANAQARGGDDLMRVGLFLDDHAWEAQARGDFQARLFVLEAATG